jgi:hypothetical protein
MASSRTFLRRAAFCCIRVAAVLLGLLSGPAWAAKAPELSAIEIYPAGDRYGYVQISGFTLNTRNEVHLCGDAPAINKNIYGKLPKLTLAVGMSLERAKDGPLLLRRGGGPECIIPGNLKLEKSEGETAAQLADAADIGGQIVGKSISSTSTIPRLLPRVKIELVAALDTEVAEFLLAQASDRVDVWKSYLGKYPSGPHVGDAKPALARLYVQEGQTDLAAYQASAKAGQANYDKLQAAKYALDSAGATMPGTAEQGALGKSISVETNDLNLQGRTELGLYRDALAKPEAGYVHLVNAEKLSRWTLLLDPNSPQTRSLSQGCLAERKNLDDSRVASANDLLANRPDEAYVAIMPFRAFSPEYPEVLQSLHAIYSHYLEAGKAFMAKGAPQDAVPQFEKASEIEPTPEVQELLRDARQKAQDSSDKSAVAMATSVSIAAEDEKDFIKAYEVLDDLSLSQKKMVADRLDELKDKYVQKASQTAKDLQRIHLPIKGTADEIGIQRAYDLLNRCHGLSSDPGIDDQMAVLGGRLSDYYLSQAKHYLDRPDGTGANVGWAYLQEALKYNRTDANEIHDEETIANPAHQLRSRLSIRVSFLDQTSRRDAVAFAEQLNESMAIGLESPGLHIKVVGPHEEAKVQPNFFLVGSVLQHSHSSTLEENPKQSEYRSGESEQINPEWVAANREYETASDNLQTQQSILQGVTARGKKGQVKNARQAVQDAEEKKEAARIKLDSLQKSSHVSIERPYTYIEQIYHLKATVELRFNIQDSSEAALIPNVPILETGEQPVTVLKDVKSDDTMGVRSKGEAPSETQYLEKVENEALNHLLKEAKEKIATLPVLTLSSADRKAAEADNDGAAELYILYLNSTENLPTPERKKAQKFLAENFNFRSYGETPKS